MTRQERIARFCLSLAAVAGGWAAAMVATLPMALFKVWSETVIETRSIRALLWALGAGAAVWFAWSLAIVFGAWLLGALPAIALVREQWLLRHKRLAILLSAALAEAVVLVNFHCWRWLDPDHSTNARLFTLYSLLLTVFAAATAGFYLRLVGRKRSAAMRDPAHSRA